MKIRFKGLEGILLKESSWECMEVLAKALTKDQCYDFRYNWETKIYMKLEDAKNANN